MDQRFYITKAHIRALKRLVFIHCAAEPEQGLAACLLSDPLTIFQGQSPGQTLADWMGLKPPFDAATRMRVLDFYHSLPKALSIALQQATCPAAAQKLLARGSLAMLLGYGGSEADSQRDLPQLDEAATRIALALANDPQTRFASLAPLIQGIQNPSYYFLPTQSHLGFLQTLRFGWNWFVNDDEEFAELFFAEPSDITLVEYLSYIPAMTAELPQAANQEASQIRLINELEPALSYFLGADGLEEGAYYRCRQTRGYWRPEASRSPAEKRAQA